MGSVPQPQQQSPGAPFPRRLPPPPFGEDEQRRYREAWSHWRDDRPVLALARMRDLARLYPRRAQHHYNLGSMLSGTGDLPGAVECFREAVRIAPDYFQGLAGLGIALARRASVREDEGGDGVAATLLFTEAATVLERAIKAAPAEEPAAAYHPNVYLAFAFGRLRRLPEAVEAYRAALKLNPRDADAWSSLARLLWGLRRHVEAADAYERAMALHGAAEATPLRGGLPGGVPVAIGPAPATLCEEVARLYLLLDQPAAAVIKCRKALALDPEFAPAHQTLARALEKLGDSDGARLALERAARLPGGSGEKVAAASEPDPVAALEVREAVRRAYADFNAAWKEDRLSDAARAMRAAIAAEPAGAVHHFNLALVRRRQDRVPEAVSCLREALRHDPDHAGALCVLGAILAWRAFCGEAAVAHDPAEVRRRYEAALDLLDRSVAGAGAEKQTYQTHMYRGLCLGRLKRMDDAADAFDRADELAPANLWPRLLRADVLWYAGRSAEAENILRALLAAPFAPTPEQRADICERLARVLLWGQKDPPSAAAACRAALEAAPDRPRAHEILSDVLERLGDRDAAADAALSAAALRFRQRKTRRLPTLEADED
jgi:tetratricopeptide (TPR) repeat protein